MSDGTPILVQLEQVSKTYGDHAVRALTDISLNVLAGEFVALMGPSGCGKSTLLNIIGGIDRPSSGKVWIANSDLTLMSDEKCTLFRRKNIGYIFQFFNLLSTLTVFENVALPLELEHTSRSEVRERVTTMLTGMGMKERMGFYPAQLSGGEMQRVAIARALVHSPQLVIADEPTGNLDSENGTAILQLIAQLNKEKMVTVVMATHSNEASSYAGRVVHMRDGGIIKETEQCFSQS